jgi:hypothetical protein
LTFSDFFTAAQTYNVNDLNFLKKELIVLKCLGRLKLHIFHMFLYGSFSIETYAFFSASKLPGCKKIIEMLALRALEMVRRLTNFPNGI